MMAKEDELLEIRAREKFGAPLAFVFRAFAYRDGLNDLTAGISKFRTLDNGAWHVAFDTPHGIASIPADVARAWADQLDTPKAAALGGFQDLVAALRRMADQCDQINAGAQKPN